MRISDFSWNIHANMRRKKIVATAVGLAALLGFVKITLSRNINYFMAFRTSVYPTNENNRAVSDIIKSTPPSSAGRTTSLTARITDYNVSTGTNISPPSSNRDTNISNINNTIVVSQSISSLGMRAQQAADLILGKVDEDVEESLSLRSELRPGIRYDHRDPCTLSFKRRKCNSERKPSLPFVSGDLFRCLADIIFDETNNYEPEDSDIACLHYLRSSLFELHGEPFLIFVKTDMIHNNSPDSLKAKIDDVIPGAYILVTHNSDFGANTDGVQGKVERSLSKLVWWYGQNIPSGESRTTIPIGLENLRWNHQFPSYYSGMEQQEKSFLATASFSPRNVERENLLQKLIASPWVDTPGFGYKASTTTPEHEAWLREQTKYRFVFSPPGNGIDCHRTWEMVLVGVIPILRTTIIDSIFVSLQAVGRALVVDNWDVVNQTLLENHWTKWGDSIVREQKRWMEDIDNNIMLAKHWIIKFSTKMEQLSKTEGRHNDLPEGIK